MDKKYITIRNKYLADGLAFCGFSYHKYTNNENKTVYTFEETDMLNNAIKTILNIKHNNIK